MKTRLTVEGLIEDCCAAVAQESSARSVREVIARAVSSPGELIAVVGEPRRAAITPLYHAPELTVLHVIWGPGMTLPPHDHRMWAVIGIYTGREDNIFWRRVPDAPQGKIEAAGAKAISTGDAVPLGREIIHSVTNPIPRLTGAIHVYGGDFFEQDRSMWDPEHLTEGENDVAHVRALFEASNAALELG